MDSPLSSPASDMPPVDYEHAALAVIDMQEDFCEPVSVLNLSEILMLTTEGSTALSLSRMVAR